MWNGWTTATRRTRKATRRAQTLTVLSTPTQFFSRCLCASVADFFARSKIGHRATEAQRKNVEWMDDGHTPNPKGNPSRADYHGSLRPNTILLSVSSVSSVFSVADFFTD